MLSWAIDQTQWINYVFLWFCVGLRFRSGHEVIAVGMVVEPDSSLYRRACTIWTGIGQVRHRGCKMWGALVLQIIQTQGLPWAWMPPRFLCPEHLSHLTLVGALKLDTHRDKVVGQFTKLVSDKAGSNTGSLKQAWNLPLTLGCLHFSPCTRQCSRDRVVSPVAYRRSWGPM